MGLGGLRPQKPDQTWSYRCSMCGISFPMMGACKGCGEPTSLISNDPPDPDWEYKLQLLLSPEAVELDKAQGWRFKQLLLEGGYGVREAEILAVDKSVDLHEAVELGKKTPFAFAILS
jgi:hypothetical protein